LPYIEPSTNDQKKSQNRNTPGYQIKKVIKKYILQKL